MTVHVVLTVVLALAVASPGAGVGLLADRRRVPSCSASWPWAGGVGRESGLLDAALDRLPGDRAPDAARRARRPADGAGAVHGRGRRRGGLRRARLRGGLRLARRRRGRRGRAARARASCCCRTPPPPCSGWPPGPGFFVGSGTLVSVHGVTLGPVPALPLLAALPDTQAVPLLAFVSQVVPGGGRAGGRDDGRALVHRRGRRLDRGRPDRDRWPGVLWACSAACWRGSPAARWATARCRRSARHRPRHRPRRRRAERDRRGARGQPSTRWRAAGLTEGPVGRRPPPG